ncbi:RNA polymerase sigma factor [Chloroflexus sp.]|uniref:RNA polymerase sigma factor n=1 Tax=Chloroflexus sp. TaxID=1904827 RepID=UPI00261F111E|nr:RNA polymerase sigma factor [uncultured Chloroflexus sp.]
MPGPIIDLSLYDDEQALLDGLRRGDPDACTCFVKRFAPLVYARALRLLGDADDAENVLQTTFIKACAALSEYTGAGSLKSWLYRIASNEGLMLLRQKRPQVGLDAAGELTPDETDLHFNIPWALDPARSVLEGELRREIARAIAELPDGLREVVVLRDIEQLSTEETAERLGISAGAVKVRLHRARLRLREALARYLETVSETTSQRDNSA